MTRVRRLWVRIPVPAKDNLLLKYLFKWAWSIILQSDLYIKHFVS